MKPEFNKELFREVVEANAKSLHNAITMEAFDESILIGNPLKTEDETRQMAVNFFKATLAKELAKMLRHY